AGTLDRAGVGLEHEVELPGLGEAVAGAAVGADPRVVELVLAEPLAAVAAVDQRVREVLEVAGRLPHRRRRQDGGVEADDVVAQLHHRAPPRVLDVAQQQHADRAVVVGRAEPAVDLGRREDEAAAPAEVDDLVEQRGVRLGRAAARRRGLGGGQLGGGGVGHGGPVYGPAGRSRNRPPAPSRAGTATVLERATVSAYSYPAAAPPQPRGAADPPAVMARRTGAWVVDLLIYLVIMAFLGPTPLSPLAEYYEVEGVDDACEILQEGDQYDVAFCAVLGDRAYVT